MNAKAHTDPDLPFNAEMKLEGWYTLEVKRADGSVRKKLRFKNLITNAGLDMLGGSYPDTTTAFGFPIIFCGCDVGTGSAAPSFSDTQCQTKLAGVRNPNGWESGSSVVAGPPLYFSTLYTATFGTGVAAGNLTEVVIGNYSAATPGVCTAFSRALILDGGGAPTTLTVLPTEILTVVYELRVYPVVTDTAYSFTQGATTYSGVFRPANSTTAIGISRQLPTTFLFNIGTTIGAITTTISGGFLSGGTAGSGNGSGTVGPYVNGSYTLQYSWTWNATTATGTMGALSIATGIGAFQFSMTPTVVKGSGQSLNIQGAFSWARL